MAIQIYHEDLTSFERVLSAALAGEEKACKEARRYRGTYTPLSCRSLLILYILVWRDYYRGQLHKLQAVLIGIGIIIVPVVVLVTLGGAFLLWRGRRR